MGQIHQSNKKDGMMDSTYIFQNVEMRNYGKLHSKFVKTFLYAVE